MDHVTEMGYEAEPTSRYQTEQELRPLDDLMSYVREYVKENPEMAALACFGVGFVLGWKLKPW